jgi:hypothetical protein
VTPSDYRRQVEAERRAFLDAGGQASVPASVRAGSDWSQDLEELMNTERKPRDRESALWRLQAGTFLVGQFAEYRGRYIQALQMAATDPDQGLRHAAFDVLANGKDDFARRKLVEGLTDPGKALVSPTVALGLLARDDHGAATTFARSFLSSKGDPTTRAQAARVLAADPDSGSLLAERMRDTREFREVRRASAVALHSLDPDKFFATARDILSDAGDFQDIKTTLLGALERDDPAPMAASAES